MNTILPIILYAQASDSLKANEDSLKIKEEKQLTQIAKDIRNYYYTTPGRQKEALRKRIFTYLTSSPKVAKAFKKFSKIHVKSQSHKEYFIEGFIFGVLGYALPENRETFVISEYSTVSLKKSISKALCYADSILEVKPFKDIIFDGDTMRVFHIFRPGPFFPEK